MVLSEYLAGLVKNIEDYSRTDLIINGRITFIDGSRLFLKTSFTP